MYRFLLFFLVSLFSAFQDSDYFPQKPFENLTPTEKILSAHS